MTADIRDLSGRRLEQVNLSRTRVHGAFLSDTKVTGAWVHSLDLSGNIQSLVVNGVEVAGYVQTELERRHPELGYLDSKDVPGLQRAWAKVQEIAAATLDTARRLPPAVLDEAVDGEDSYLQTLRHLVFATDRWVTGPVLGVLNEPYRHRSIQLAPGDMLVLATDGLTEARDRRGAFLGDEGAGAWIEQESSDPSQLTSGLIARLRRLEGNALHDDVAILAIRADGRG